MSVNLPKRWLDSKDWSAPLELIDRLHLARIHPAFCDTEDPVCGVAYTRVSSDKTLCQEYAEDPNRKRNFPVAQCILDWREKDGDSQFVNVVCQLGLLQTVILPAQLDVETHRYAVEHLEKSSGLELPWLRSNSSGEPQLDQRRDKMNEIFRNYRTAADIQEFVSLLESPTGDELRGGSRRILGRKDLALRRLSDNEQRYHMLLVSDMEQSFFSLLFILSAANNHASELAGNSLQTLKEWIRGTPGSALLRSELCHKDHTLDDSRPKDEFVDGKETHRPDESKGDRELQNAQFWRASTFEEAAYALGFLDARSNGSITARFERLAEWLCAEAAQTEPHPALTVRVYKEGQAQSLISSLELNLIQLKRHLQQPSLNSLRVLCEHMIVRLSQIYIRTRSGRQPILDDPGHLTEFRGATTNLPGVRFNLPGEYLLRKAEPISRNFFATALGYARDESDPFSRPLLGAFAVGTLIDMPAIDEQTKPRLRALRALLRTIVQFGTDRSMTQLWTSYRNKERAAQQYHAEAHEIKKVTRFISADTPPHVLNEIKMYFNTLFTTKETLTSAFGEGMFPSDFGAGKNLRDFVANAMRIAARIETVVSDTRSRTVNTEVSELHRAARLGEHRLQIEVDSAASIDASESDPNRAMCCSALICALRNVIQHSAADSPITITLDAQRRLVIRNKGRDTQTGLTGEVRPEVFHPGKTREAIRFYVGQYSADSSKVWMDWDPDDKAEYLTMIPWPW
jgi:hypothetical protein